MAKGDIKMRPRAQRAQIRLFYTVCFVILITRQMFALIQAGRNTNKMLEELRQTQVETGGDHSFIPKCYFYANERGRN